jgi:hypothetical protein
MLAEMNLKQPKPTTLITDSQNARLTVLNPLNAARTRHIDIKYKWIIDKTSKGIFDIQQVGTAEMTADGLTKPLKREKHTKFLHQLKMCNISPV